MLDLHEIKYSVLLFDSGAVLASPENIFINLAMRNVMKNKQLPWDRVHTGVHATFSKGDFFSVGGI